MYKILWQGVDCIFQVEAVLAPESGELVLLLKLDGEDGVSKAQLWAAPNPLSVRLNSLANARWKFISSSILFFHSPLPFSTLDPSILQHTR